MKKKRRKRKDKTVEEVATNVCADKMHGRVHVFS